MVIKCALGTSWIPVQSSEFVQKSRQQVYREKRNKITHTHTQCAVRMTVCSRPLLCVCQNVAVDCVKVTHSRAAETLRDGRQSWGDLLTSQNLLLKCNEFQKRSKTGLGLARVESNTIYSTILRYFSRGILDWVSWATTHLSFWIVNPLIPNRFIDRSVPPSHMSSS